MIFACEEDVVCLTSGSGSETVDDKILELPSTQEEADIQIILHIPHIAETTLNTIIVRFLDTDVFILLL